MSLNLKKIKLSINWVRVRSLGSLKILTKASYIALIIVPLIAALWPGVKFSINRYNAIVAEAVSTLDYASTNMIGAANQLNTQIPETDTDSLSKQDITKNVNSIRNELVVEFDKIQLFLDRAIIDSNHLPPVLAKSFFAALFVVFAHLLYDIYLLYCHLYSSSSYETGEGYRRYTGRGSLRISTLRDKLGSALFNA